VRNGAVFNRFERKKGEKELTREGLMGWGVEVAGSIKAQRKKDSQERSVHLRRKVKERV